MGKAAHITAESGEGPRYDPTLPSADRAGANNGIWLCAHCADLVDKVSSDYSVALLREWKAHAEHAAREGLEVPQAFVSGRSNAYTIATVLRFKSPSRGHAIARMRPPPGKAYYEPVELRPMAGPEDWAVHDPHFTLTTAASFGPSPTATAFVLQLENKGTGVEPHAWIQVRMNGPKLWYQQLSPAQRLTPITDLTEHSRSSIGGFRVLDLMPGEIVTAEIRSHRPGPFNASCFTSSFRGHATPIVLDVIFGPPSLSDPLPPNPSVENAEFPIS